MFKELNKKRARHMRAFLLQLIMIIMFLSCVRAQVNENIKKSQKDTLIMNTLSYYKGTQYAMKRKWPIYMVAGGNAALSFILPSMKIWGAYMMVPPMTGVLISVTFPYKPYNSKSYSFTQGYKNTMRREMLFASLIGSGTGLILGIITGFIFK